MMCLDYSWITTFLVFVLTYLLVFYSTRKPKGIPPGPFLFPVIGNLTSFAGDLLVNLERLQHKFGDIYSLYAGNELMIFLNGYDVIQDALLKKASVFIDRPFNSYDKLVVPQAGIIFANGKLWKSRRRSAMKALHELCFKDGGKNIENIITQEVTCLVKQLGTLKHPADIEVFLKISFLNVIVLLAYKDRFGFDDRRVLRLLALSKEGAADFMLRHTMVNCFPFLSILPADVLRIRKTIERYHQQIEILRPFLNRIKCQHTDEKSDTLVDFYLNFWKEQVKNDTTDMFKESQLEITTYDLVGAGGETSATTVRWLLIYFIRHPEIQERMFKEIQSIIGERTPRLSDKARLPYTEAVILEGLRISSVAPLAVPHSVAKDVIFHGYLLPKGCTVMVNIHSSNNDPRVWEKPAEFRPERFLSGDGSEIVIPKQFIPFSLGPRSCLGEKLAKLELFLFVTTLVQHFKFLPAPEEEMPSVEGDLGITYSPKPYKIKIVKRCD